MKPQLTNRQIWGMPIVLAVITAIGLVSALVADGPWDALSWIALCAPVAVIIWHVVGTRPLAGFRARRSFSQNSGV